MYVMEILPDVLEVDLCCSSQDEDIDGNLISLRNALVFLEFANYVEEPVRINRLFDAKYLVQIRPKPGDSFKGIITHVVSPTRFYLQKVSLLVRYGGNILNFPLNSPFYFQIGPENEYLIKLTDKLSSTYDKNSHKYLIYNPVIGTDLHILMGWFCNI